MQSYTLRHFASKQFNLVSRKTDTMQKIQPNVKAMIDQQMNTESFIINQKGQDEYHDPPTVSASTLLKKINSNFEVFFQKRDYTERNFASYL